MNVISFGQSRSEGLGRMIASPLLEVVFEEIKVRWEQHNEATVFLTLGNIRSLLRQEHLQFLYEMSPGQVG